MIKRLLFACLTLSIILSAALVTTASRFAAPRLLQPFQQDLPVDGWSVCKVGGVESIPGIGARQTFVLCQGQGWQIRTYCLQPGAPAPALGKACSYVGRDTYWCGDTVQELLRFGILQAPTPITPATATRVASRTPTPAATSVQPTPLLDTVAAPIATRTPRLRSTVYPRPRPGGPGNLGYILGGGGLMGAAVLAGAAVTLILLRRKLK